MPPQGASSGPVQSMLEQPDFEETTWIVPGVATEGDQAPRLVFSTLGKVTGFTGCNQLTGTYRLEGDRLEVAAATTKRACVGAGGEVEARLLAILADRPRVLIGSENMVLTAPKGGRIEFIPQGRAPQSRVYHSPS
ncbi:hypothetical protein BWI17_11910 [Betaproteobacteria bacterium GR16-43]|nr:hypothetical protein BWI17_11910 [Betaproteobacteria bacterium GR16-43]